MACMLLMVRRSNLYYLPKMPVKDAPVIVAMKKLSDTYPRFGSRRIRIILRREGTPLGKVQCSRLWAKAGLQVTRKRRRKLAVSIQHRLVPTAWITVWRYDFVYDACANGQKLKCLRMIDEYTRECLAIDVKGSIYSSRVIEILSKLMQTHGVLCYLQSDNGQDLLVKRCSNGQLKRHYRLSSLSQVNLGRMVQTRVLMANFVIIVYQ